jgi:hypothetical protein
LLASASLPPRRTTALPVLMQMAATSLVTLGRDSYTTPTTPSGTRRFEIARPFGRLTSSNRSPIGSARRETASTSRAIPATRSGVRRKRSISIRADAFAQSCAFAARISLSRARIAFAIAASARFFRSLVACASTIDAAFAPAALSINSSVMTGISNPKSPIPNPWGYNMTTLFL